MPGEFKFDAWLSSKDMSLVGMGEDGRPLVQKNNGEVAPINMEKVITSLGKDPAEVKNIRYNQPTSALDVSPLTTEQRAKLSVGNARGSLQYLKRNFEGAEYVPDQGLVVKKGGVWHRVDPDGLGGGNAWDKTKELMKDIVDLGDVAISGVASGVGAAGGAIAAGPAAVAGGVLGAGGGQAWASTLNASLGRLAGTYDATPTEQLADTGLESLMAMGGQAIAPGVKPTLGALKTGAMKAGKFMSDRTKDVVAGVYGQITGVGSEAMYGLLNKTAPVINKLDTFIKRAGPEASGELVAAEAKKHGIGVLNKIVEMGTKALPQRYGQLLETLADSAEGKGFSVNVGDLVENAMKAIEDAGLGKFVPKVSGKAGQFRSLVTGQGRELTPPTASVRNGTAKFVPLTTEEVAERIAQDMPGEALTKEHLKFITPMINTLMDLGKIGDLKGKAAAKVLTRLNTHLNQYADDAFKLDNPALNRLMTIATNGYEEGVSKAFQKAGLAEEHAALSNLYAEYGNSVNRMRRVLKNDGAEALYNSISKSADKNLRPKGDVESLVKLIGEEGEKHWDDLITSQTAGKFARWTPQFGPAAAGAVSGGGAAAALATKLGMATMAGAATVGTQLSPRIVARQFSAADKLASKALPYAGAGLNFLRSIPPDKVKQFISSDEAVSAFMRTMPAAFQKEDQDTQELLQKAGL